MSDESQPDVRDIGSVERRVRNGVGGFRVAAARVVAVPGFLLPRWVLPLAGLPLVGGFVGHC